MKESQCKQILNMIAQNGSVTGMDCYEAETFARYSMEVGA